MPSRRGVGVVPSATGGGLTGAVSGFLQVREMAREARLAEERHNMQMQMFQQQLKESDLGMLATRLDMLGQVSTPGQKLSQVAPEFAGELAQTLGGDPAQFGEMVLKPFGPEHLMSEGLLSYRDSLDPEGLARVGEIAALQGRTMDEVDAAAAEGRYGRLLNVARADFVTNSPDEFAAMIAQELGPEQEYTIGVYGHNISLNGRDAADILVRMQAILEANKAGNTAKEERDFMIRWIRDTAEEIGVTAPLPKVLNLLDSITDPNLSYGEMEGRINALRESSDEFAFLVDAVLDGVEVGSTMLRNMYRDDPEVGPMLNFLDFVQRQGLEMFPADERSQVLHAFQDAIRRATGVHYRIGGFPGFRGPRATTDQPAAVDPGEQMGFSPSQMDAMVTGFAESIGRPVDEVRRELEQSGVLPRADVRMESAPVGHGTREPGDGELPALDTSDPVVANLVRRIEESEAEMVSLESEVTQAEQALEASGSEQSRILDELFPGENRPAQLRRARGKVAQGRRRITELQRLITSWENAAAARSR